MKPFLFAGLLVVLPWVAPVTAQPHPLPEATAEGRIVVIGDSTVASYGVSHYPQKGWGQELQTFIDDSKFTVINRARGGRSSKSFIVEGLWDKVKAELKPGDHLLIQWGHNDRDFTKPERHTTTDQYEGYLTRYVTEARTLGAVPVFVTPMVMNAWRGDTLRNVFREPGNDYVGEMKRTASHMNVPLIDLNARSHAYFSTLDARAVARLYFHTYAAGEYPNFPDGHEDGTHFQEMGALLMAMFVAEDFRDLEEDPRMTALARSLKPLQSVVIEANIPNAGTVTSGIRLPLGASFTLRALPNAGYRFVQWQSDSLKQPEAANPATMVITPGIHRYTACFEASKPDTLLPSTQ